MSDQEILDKALAKAKANGLKTNWISIHPSAAFELIFTHSFAKAFWGTERCCSLCGYSDSERQRNKDKWKPGFPIFHGCNFCDGGDWDSDMWEYELRNMVVEEDPIKYLEKFL